MKIRHAFILLSAFYFLFSLSANAAELKFNLSQKEVGVGQLFEAVLILDSQSQILNALEGKISISSNLKVISVNDANSIVGLWVQKPQIGESEISFSGIMPGGYQGVQGSGWEGVRPGEILKLVIKAEKVGRALVKLNEAKVLLNNGSGSEAELSIVNPDINVIKSSVSSYVAAEDKTPPEEFLPDMASDPNVYDGKWFLIFKARDLGSGIDHFVVLEEYPPFYFKKLFFWQNNNSVAAESPYLLLDQNLKSRIIIKAIDRSGNSRVSELEPRNPLQWYENYLIWFIIMIGAVSAYFFYIFSWRKSNTRVR